MIFRPFGIPRKTIEVETAHGNFSISWILLDAIAGINERYRGLDGQGPLPPPPKQSQGPEIGERVKLLDNFVFFQSDFLIFLESPLHMFSIFLGFMIKVAATVSGRISGVVLTARWWCGPWGAPFSIPIFDRIKSFLEMNFAVLKCAKSQFSMAKSYFFLPEIHIFFDPLVFWGTSHCLWANARFLLVMSMSPFLLVNLNLVGQRSNSCVVSFTLYLQ